MTNNSGALSVAAAGATYFVSQFARIAWFTGHYVAGRIRMSRRAAAAQLAGYDRRALREAFVDLFSSDWRNIASGEYKMPAELIRPHSPGDLWRRSRDYLQDTEEISRRQDERGHSEVYDSVLAERFPRYYLQNFHFQSDGWLSAASADRYDMQVETLFTGAAAAMRRQALPAIRRAIGGRDPASLKLIDLACGTGAFLRAVKANWPLLAVTALDLSPAYLGKARTTLARYREVSYVEANAEATGLPDSSFDIVTGVYFFHELPPAVRAKVVAEAARLMKPGGVFVHVDTIQYGDRPEFEELLAAFPEAFHEPYYDGYCRENLDKLFGGAGLERHEAPALAFLSKVTVYRKAGAQRLLQASRGCSHQEGSSASES